MTRTDWTTHPAVRKIDVRKLSVLMALINQSEGKNFQEMIPFIIQANKGLSDIGLAFTADEVNLIFDILRQDLSPEENANYKKLMSLVNMPLSQ